MRWQDRKLDLGALGVLRVMTNAYRQDRDYFWEWDAPGDYDVVISERTYSTEAAARRAAVAWLRRALQQASKRVEGGKC
jgi:hypothetical protein